MTASAEGENYNLNPWRRRRRRRRCRHRRRRVVVGPKACPKAVPNRTCAETRKTIGPSLMPQFPNLMMMMMTNFMMMMMRMMMMKSIYKFPHQRKMTCRRINCSVWWGELAQVDFTCVFTSAGGWGEL